MNDICFILTAQWNKSLIKLIKEAILSISDSEIYI